MRVAAVTLAALLLGGCPNRDVGDDALDRIASCGGGLSISKNLRLALAVDVRDGSLSAQHRSDIKAVIFSQVSSINQLPVYQRYADCITSEQARRTLLDEILIRRAAFERQLEEDGSFTKAERRDLLSYYDKEYDLLKQGRLLESREARTELVREYYQLALTSSSGVPPPPPPPAPPPPPPPVVPGGTPSVPVENPAAPPVQYSPSPPGPTSGMGWRDATFYHQCIAVEEEALCRAAISGALSD